MNEAELTSIISTGYSRLAEYARASGQDLHFEVTGFLTLQPAEWSTISWFDAVTPPGGESIGGSRGVNYDSANKIKSIEFDFFWTTRDEYRESAEGQEAEKLTLEQVIFLTRADDPEARKVTSVTTFQVTVSLGGRSRTYNAIVLWDEREAKANGEGLKFDILDNVTVGVPESFQELPPDEDFASGKRTLGKPPVEAQDPQGAAFIPKAQSNYFPCEENDRRLSATLQDQSAANHITGNHWLKAYTEFKCQCTSSCTQDCSIGNFTYEKCDDTGAVTGSCHVYSLPSHAKHDTDVYDTRAVGPASCSVAAGCGIRECLFCACSVSLSISRWGAGFKYTPSPGAGYIQDEQTHQCYPCNTVKPPDGGSPLLVDLDRKGFMLSGLSDSVAFDFDGDGDLDRMAWTSADSGDAFLALDRNGNGKIDDGLELFGDRTAQPQAKKPNGYLALAVFDANGDVVIDSQDPVFSELLLWIDSNHDAVSQPGELSTLDDSGIDSIDLKYHESRRRDGFGNEFRFSGSVALKSAGVTQSSDVFFVLE